MRENFKRLLALALVFLLVLAPNAKASGMLSYEDEVEVIFAGNVENGETYYSKNEDLKKPAASMSKLMTYLIIKDEIYDGKFDEATKVTVDEVAASFAVPGNSRFDMVEGEVLTVGQLLEGMMVVSGNDAAVQLARLSSGSEEEFVKKMNAKAGEIGLSNSSFVNSSGLTEFDEEGNPSYNEMTARDLFNLSRHILNKYPETEKYGMTAVINMPERNYIGESTLPLRDTMPGMKGLKTGFTNEAGYCFTGYFDMDLQEPGQKYSIITVVMGADTLEMRSTTTRELVDLVEARYSYRDLVNVDIPVVDIKINQAEEKYIKLYPAEGFKTLLPRNAQVDMSYDVKEEVDAPIEDGEVLGSMTLSYKGDKLTEIDLINRGYQQKENFFAIMWRGIIDFFNTILMLF